MKKPQDIGKIKEEKSTQSLIKDHLNRNEFIELIKNRIENTHIEMVIKDVRPFIKSTEDLEIWSMDYFLQLADRILFHNEKINDDSKN